MKLKNLRYFSAKSVATQNSIELITIDDLVRLVEMHNLREVFVLLSDTGVSNYFAVMYQNHLMQMAALGFKTIDDYYHAHENKFPDYESYYGAKENGCETYEDYNMLSQSGIKDKEEFAKVKQGGFIEGFKEWQTAETLPPNLHNAVDLYRLAHKNGFTDFKTFAEASFKGFTTKNMYDIAREYGFPTMHEYEESKQRGFSNYKEMTFANEHKIRDHEDLLRWGNLNTSICENCGCDGKVLNMLISKLEQNKRISINKLMDLFEKAIHEFRYPDNNELPQWFDSILTSRQNVIDFLMHNEEKKKFGTYDNDGEFFEINHMKDRKVVIDGSNVAHNTQGNANGKPTVANLIKLVTFLRQKHFTEITIISDASLKYKLEDQEKLSDLKDLAEYLEAPRETSADSFLIKHVKQTHCLLVSNDTFRQWKVNDPWVAENIDYYRLAFIIKDNEVLMPDLK